jgi:uncharacterized protein YbjT (DUF2867 family)
MNHNIIVAGASGYLGRHIIAELINRQLTFKALVRSKSKMAEFSLTNDQLIEAEVTNRTSLKGALDKANILISTIGITRQKDGLTYDDVDFQANQNLLNEAIEAGVGKMIYVAVLDGPMLRNTKMVDAKERFVEVLKQSGMEYTIVRPNGFFSDLKDFLTMAESGRIYLFGNGMNKLNPIHGSDLAKVIIDEMDSEIKELEIGGPDVLTQKEIAELALSAYKTNGKITFIPDWVRNLTIKVLPKISPLSFYGPIEFFMSMMGDDHIAPRYGTYRLKNFFIEQADRLT